MPSKYTREDSGGEIANTSRLHEIPMLYIPDVSDGMLNSIFSGAIVWGRHLLFGFRISISMCYNIWNSNPLHDIDISKIFSVSHIVALSGVCVWYLALSGYLFIVHLYHLRCPMLGYWTLIDWLIDWSIWLSQLASPEQMGTQPVDMWISIGSM